MVGKNFVELIGRLRYPEVKEVGLGFPKFSGKLEVPAEYFFDDGTKKVTETDVKLVAWFELAESLGEVPQGTVLKIHGHLQERHYAGSCKRCGVAQRKYWTDVLVTNFVVLENE